MDVKTIIAPKREIKPTIYAYTTPTNTAKQGWIKIGYTDRDADKRIWEQTHTVGIEPKKLWAHEARFNGGGYFSDHEFHTFLRKNGVRRNKGTEWFYFNGEPEKALSLYREFVFKDYSKVQKEQQLTYQLRAEQELAVGKTLSYAQENPNSEFLWNAKPRFGKTLTAYDLVRKLDAVNVLIVTNRPAIANSWYDDFEKFIAWQTDYKFVSESDSLKDRPVMTHSEFADYATSTAKEARQIAFLSLQDLKGSLYFGGGYDKLDWVAKLPWDILIIDEAHEGVDTFKTDVAFEKINRQFTLHLSGTPFKAIAKGEFSDNQIFNWSYEDEQEAKIGWEGEENNPYENLPQLNMLTYQMSKMITDEVNQGLSLEDGNNVDFAFDLNEFFSTKEDGHFVHEADILKWLNTLTTNDKYPFSTPELRNELKHTFWILNRVASTKALYSLLKRHSVFENYEIVLAAGDGKSEEEDYSANESSLKRVKEAIKNNDKTITLSVGQLTTGVTIPEWTAVMMLSNMKSPALYMQAAFRAQNPHIWTEKSNGDEIRYQKKNAYVFDFAPERTLSIFDEFANNLSTRTVSGGGTTRDREENIRRLLNFFPVIGEDSEGKMVELDATQVLTIPKTIKAVEVVKRGFMSNLLFANIAGIFQAPQAALDILDNMDYVTSGKVKKAEEQPPVDTKDIKVDDDGEAVIDSEIVIAKTDAIFGEKVYTQEKVKNLINETLQPVEDKNSAEFFSKNISKVVTDIIKPQLQDVKDEYKITQTATNRIEKDIENQVKKSVDKANADFIIQKAHIENDLKESAKKVSTEQELEEIKKEYQEKIQDAVQTHSQEIEKRVVETLETVQKEIIEKQEQRIKNKVKSEVEEDVRGRLRGFARTIPSFIMAYGDEKLTLDNFDQYTPENVFQEVTGITVDQFLFLRDGRDYEENGEQLHFAGKLFDEVVFNESVQEFLRKKNELADYFEENEEDIFDYIPPQNTNQIYTPKWVVKMMVDDLEKENPGIYDDSNKTFADLYMKSGLYITEVVKKLYNSSIIKEEFPDDNERLKHILENQVYGFAPTEIIYKIATNFIFGNLDQSISRKNFVQEDTVPYVKNNRLQDLINISFGE